MLNICVIFGGRTVEHDVSVVTGNQLISNIDQSKYNVIPVYISREGEWFTGEKLRDINFIRSFDPADKSISKAYISPVTGQGLVIEAGSGLFAKQQIIKIDVAIPAMHGMHGEDGTIQGLFELANIAYTSAGVVGSAVGMDKIVMRAAFKGLGLPVLESEYFSRSEWEATRDKVLAKIESALKYPLFVKPANLGSSIGINRADDKESLTGAIDVAVNYDSRVIVERAVTDITEINCSCVGYGDDVMVSVCEQPISWKEFLTFDEKYLRGTVSKGMRSLDRIIPADIPQVTAQEIQDMSAKIFKALNCKGVVRIDYIIDETEMKVYVNEINTIPGSFAFYLWEPQDISFARLIDRLIEDAIKANADKNQSVFAYDSNLLSKVASGAKIGKLK